MKLTASWRQFILGCSVGNILEWYDFILYGYFSPIIASLFFPAENPYISMLLTFSVFASGCLMRPFGSLLFGHIGDTYGRKHALLITIVIITLATTSIGLLPTYAHAGLLAPILLTVSRLVQGLAVSGEEVGAAIFLTENAPKHRRAFAGSLILGSVYVGLLLGALSALGVNAVFSHASVLLWGWRLPFLAAFIFGVIAFVIRLRDLESPAFNEKKSQKAIATTPVKEVFKHYRRSILVAILLCVVFAVAIYLFVVYLPTYLKMYVGLSMQHCLMISIASLIFVSVLAPVVGLLADKIGPRRFFMLGSGGFFVCAYPIFYLILTKTTMGIIIGECIFAILLAMVAGSIFPLLVNLFPVSVRYTGIAIAFNLAMMLFGSTAPILALNIISFTGNPLSVFWLLMWVGLLSALALPFFSSVRVVEKNEWDIAYD